MSFDSVGDRNNTSFVSKLNEALKSIDKDKDDYLKYHQRLVTEYVLQYPHIKGILIYHRMGSGKTLLSVAIADALLKKSNFNRVIFISPKSLHKNFKKDFVKFTKLNPELKDKFTDNAEIEDHLSENYNFVSLNASNMIKQVERVISDVEEKTLDVSKPRKMILNEDLKDSGRKIDISLDNSVIIFDEFHNFLNSLRNGSSNAVQLYDLIMNAKNVKVIGLTGTPIVTDVYAIALGFNMMAGKLPHNQTLFGESYQEFTRNFINNSENIDVRSVSKQRPTIKNKSKFQDRILGLVSYYGADTPEFKELYPVEFDLIVKKVPMAQKQFAAYIAARDKELEEEKRGVFKEQPSRMGKPSGASSSYRVRSRQFSNILYPEYASKSWKDEQGYAHYERYMDKLEDTFFSNDLEKYSPKIVEIITMCSTHLPKDMLPKYKLPKKSLDAISAKRTKLNEKQLKELGSKNYEIGVGPGLIYSQFLDSGIKVLAKALVHNGMTDITNADLSTSVQNKSGNIAMISGDVPAEQRAELIKLFNMPDNVDGSLLCLLLVTATGAEGISLDRGRHIHIMEPYWHWARIRQVITRIIRLGSHTSLVKKDRNVQAYIYLSDYPSKITDKNNKSNINKIMKTEKTTDMSLFLKALENQFLINDFLIAIQQSSIDCTAHYDKDCRICAPNNKTLWYPELDKDLSEPSPCELYTQEKIKTKQIKVNDNIYHYTKQDGDIHIYAFDSELGAYVELDETDPNYYEIYNKIS